MKFKAYDILMQGRPRYVGEYDEGGNIISIEGVERVDQVLLSSRRANGYDVSTLQDLVRALPRLQIVEEPDDEGSEDQEVGEGDTVDPKG